MNIPPEDHPALTLLREDPLRFATQGTITTTWRTYRGRRLGPYFRLTWRENGRQRAIYLGRQTPLVDEVRHLLHEAQTIRRMLSEHRRRQALFREHVIRPIQRYLQEVFLLFGNGLYLDGWHLRGTETAALRLPAADIPEHLIPQFPVPPPEILAQFYGMPNAELGGTPPGGMADSAATHSPPPKTPSENRPCCDSNRRIPHPPQPGSSDDFSEPYSPSPKTSSESRRCCPSNKRRSDRSHPRTPPPKWPHPKKRPSKNVDQKKPWRLPSHPPSPQQSRYNKEPFKNVDQKHLNTTRGPPKKVAITLRRDERRSITRATHPQSSKPIPTS